MESLWGAHSLSLTSRARGSPPEGSSGGWAPLSSPCWGFIPHQKGLAFDAGDHVLCLEGYFPDGKHAYGKIGKKR